MAVTMIKNDDQALLSLNALIHAGRDAEAGYLAAADIVAEPELVQLFAEYALQRAKFIQELEERIRTLRSTPEKGATLAGEVHRGCMGIKADTEPNQAHAILCECERGEDLAVAAYADALKQQRDVDNQSLEIIQRQYEQVQAAHDRVKQLRDSATYAHR